VVRAAATQSGSTRGVVRAFCASTRSICRSGTEPGSGIRRWSQTMLDMTVERSARRVSVEPLREQVRGSVLTGDDGECRPLASPA
jgi:hypothetical protein